MMKNIQFRSFKVHNLSGEQRSAAFIFSPAVFFLLIGLLTILAPGLILALIASVFVFIGLVLGTLAWKFLKFKKKVEQVAKDFEGRIQVQSLNIEDAEFVDIEDDDFDEPSRKIILH